MTLHHLFATLMVPVLLFAAPTTASAQSISLRHVHGLAYSSDGKRLMIPSHHGLAVYQDGKWAKAPGPEHDYMGFSATARNLYSSGHPAPGSGLVNPFGLMRSDDGGKTWHKLGLEGETDFHLLATGWSNNAIYVWNPAPSSRMKAPGLHYTLNDGFALALHPQDPAIVAVATSEGLFVSRDHGERFIKANADGEGLSVLFDLEGKYLWHSSFDGRPNLIRVPLGDGNPVQISLPPLNDDAVAYIAQNPARRLEFAIATFERSVYLTKDAGQSWHWIADRGTAK